MLERTQQAREANVEMLGEVFSPAQEAVEAVPRNMPEPARSLAQRVGEVTEQVAETLAYGVKDGAKLAQHTAKQGAVRVGDAADHITKLAAAGVKAIGDASRQVGKTSKAVVTRTTSDLRESASDTARQAWKVRSRTEAKLARQAAKQAAKASSAATMLALKALEARTAKRLASQELALHNLELQVAKLGKRPRKRGGGGTGLLWMAALVGGGYYLARHPEVRARVRETVAKVSPSAAESLHSAGRQVRNIIGEVWIERDEHPSPSTAGGPKPAA